MYETRFMICCFNYKIELGVTLVDIIKLDREEWNVYAVKTLVTLFKVNM